MAYKRYKMLRKWVNGEPQDEYKQGELIDSTEYVTMDECNEGNQNPNTDIDGNLYEWRETNEKICYQYNQFIVEKKYVSYDNGVSWAATGETRIGSLYKVNAAECL